MIEVETVWRWDPEIVRDEWAAKYVGVCPECVKYRLQRGDVHIVDDPDAYPHETTPRVVCQSCGLILSKEPYHAEATLRLRISK